MRSRLVANKTLPASPFSSFYFTFYIRYILYRILEDSYQEPTSFHVQIVIEFYSNDENDKKRRNEDWHGRERRDR